MDWSDAEAVASLINAIAPSVTGGLIALAGVIVLFMLQQRVVRRESERVRLESAAERLMETLDSARRAYVLADRDLNGLHDMLIKSWRFAWLLKRRERPVADWAWAMLYAAMRGTEGKTKAERTAADLEMFATVMARLNDWRVKTKRVRWFRDDLVRLDSEAAALKAAALKAPNSAK